MATPTEKATVRPSFVIGAWFRVRLWFESLSPASSLVFCLLFYLILSRITAATFLGDTSDYADSIVLRFQGMSYDFWEFGHVLWRPLGWAITRSIAVLIPAWLRNNAAHYHVILVLITVSWLAGLVSLFIFHRLACLATNDFWCASVSTIGFALTQAFLNFAQAGTSYMAGLAMLLLATYILSFHYEPVRAVWASILSGIVLAGAVLVWFPYVLVVPAVVFIPLVLRRALGCSLTVGISCGVAVGLVYLAVIVDLGFHTRAEILSWVSVASHGIQISGVARVVFGFARSFINMGNDGILFKRYLLHDPFSPVSVTDLVRTALAKLALFYTLLSSVVATLVIAKRWHVLCMVTIASVPVLVFAVRWQGGDLERYLPLYPFLFLAISICLSHRRQRFQRLVCLIFIATMALVNIFALSRHARNLLEEKISGRVGSIPAVSLRDVDVLYVTHTADELSNFSRNFPEAPLNLHIRNIIEIGHNDLPMWRSTFSKGVLTAWQRNGNVWVSERVLSPVPKSEWNWVEHDDPRISWRELWRFFSALQYDECVGEDGFCLLASSPSNRRFLITNSIGASHQQVDLTPGTKASGGTARIGERARAKTL